MTTFLLPLHTALLALHAALGTAALLLFWIPAFSRKGGRNHRRYGRYYSVVMYAVAVSGALMAAIVLFDPVAIHAPRDLPPQDAVRFAAQTRPFYVFLLFLSWLTFSLIRHGNLVLRDRERRQSLRGAGHRVLLFGQLAGGVALTAMGLARGTVLPVVFGVLGVVLAGQMLRYVLGPAPRPGQWRVEHLSAMLGSGIATWTAFLTFGGRALLGVPEDWQLLLWIAPGAVGGLAIAWLSRKYTLRHRSPGLNIS